MQDKIRQENVQLQQRLYQMLQVMKEAANADEEDMDQQVSGWRVFVYWAAY